MIPAAFDYIAPQSLDEAVRALAARGEDAKLLAGGHSLLPLIKLRLANPKLLIDLARISTLNGISEQDGKIVIGALTHITRSKARSCSRRNVHCCRRRPARSVMSRCVIAARSAAA